MQASRHSRSSGISMIEIIVVMIIAAILMTMGLASLRSSRDAGATSRAISVGDAYATAVGQFAVDARGLYPGAIGSVDWPVAKDGPVSSMARGDGRYLRSYPDAVQQGIIGVNAMGTDGEITYQPSGSTGYELQVLAKDGTYRCSFAKNVTRSGLRQCSTS